MLRIHMMTTMIEMHTLDIVVNSANSHYDNEVCFDV